MLSYSLMPKNYVSLCFLFSCVFIRSLYLQFLYFVFLSVRSFIFNAIFHFVNYSCTVSKITCTRLNLVCEALSAICSTSKVQIFFGRRT